MGNYRIINDYSILETFIRWLPELEESETYYVCLLARNKYCKGITHINSDVQQLRRFTTTKERMIDKIRQAECALGSYKQKEIEIPQEALALYIHPNPRSQVIAAKRTCTKLLELLLEPYANYNVHQIALSNIQQARGRKIYTDFDYDKLSFEDFRTGMIGFINFEALTIIKTHGGFHALVNSDLVDYEFSRLWYKRMQFLAADDGAAVQGDLLMPVPGCTQGNFTPHFLIVNGIEQ
jgi:hypothetical protein